MNHAGLEIVGRVVIFGPGLSGKSTLLKAFADALGLTVDSSAVQLGAPVEHRRAHPLPARATFELVTEPIRYKVVRARSADATTELVTIPRAVWSIDAWSYLGAAAAVVLCLDSQVERSASNQEHVDYLVNAPWCPRSGCVVWTKHDLVTDHGLRPASVSIPASRSSPSREPYRDPGVASWPTFRTRFDDAASMRAPLEYLAR